MNEPEFRPTTFSLLKELKDENRIQTYKIRGRLIPTEIWEKIKARRVCDGCGTTVNYRMEVHHIIPKSKGGGNEESNLKALCADCHNKADKEAKTESRPKQDWRNPKYYNHLGRIKPKKIIKPISEEIMTILSELKITLQKVEKEIENHQTTYKENGIGSIHGQILGLITTITKLEQRQKEAQKQTKEELDDS